MLSMGLETDTWTQPHSSSRVHIRKKGGQFKWHFARILEVHYSDATWASRSVKILTHRLFVQQLLRANNKGHIKCLYVGPLWEKVTSGCNVESASMSWHPYGMEVILLGTNVLVPLTVSVPSVPYASTTHKKPQKPEATIVSVCDRNNNFYRDC